MLIKTEERIGPAKLQVELEGRLDTTTTPLLERKIKQWGDDITELTLDFSEITYISSMGLRLILQIYKSMNGRNGRLIVKNMTEPVREVFEMTGFVNLILEEEKFVIIQKEDLVGLKLLSLIGQIDGKTALSLQKELHDFGAEIFEVTLDFEKVSLISDAGYNILLKTLEESVHERKTIIQNIRLGIREEMQTKIANFNGSLRILRQDRQEIEFTYRRPSGS